MNPKDLKPGDKIMINAVVLSEDDCNNFKIAVGDGSVWIEPKHQKHATLITPSIPAQGEWKPKHLESVQVSDNNIDWHTYPFLAFNSKGCPVVERYNSACWYKHIRPIAKPVTMEEELRMILNNSDFISRIELEQRIIAWHTKHTPPQRKMPSAEEFNEWIDDNTHGYGWMHANRMAFAHFGLNEKGGEG